MKNVVYQQLQGENKTVVITVAATFSLFFSLFAISDRQHCQSDYRASPVAREVESLDNTFASLAELAGTPADLAPYSYGFYSQNYLLESIYARTPAAFSLLS